MKYKFCFILLLIAIMILSCSNDGTLEPEIVEEVYTLNLYQEDYSSYGYTLKWNKQTSSLDYSINSGSQISIQDPGTGSIDFNDKIPGTKEEIIVNATKSATMVTDTILVYMIPIEVVSWQDNSISSTSQQNTLNISTDHDVSDIDFYFAELGSQDLNNPPSLNENNGIPSSSWELLSANNGFSNYTHDKPRDAYYAYCIKYTDSNGNYRFSMVEADIGISSNLKESYTTFNISATTEQLDRIYISWDNYSGDDFFSYEVWRSNVENFNIDNDDAEKLIEISDSNINTFEDRQDIGTGSWYYRIQLKNIFGKTKVSEVIIGRAGI